MAWIHESDWQDDHHAALERIRVFNRRRFSIVKKIEPQPEPEPKPDGIIYGRVSEKISRPEAIRRIVSQSIPKPEPGEVENALYPRTR